MKTNKRKDLVGDPNPRPTKQQKQEEPTEGKKGVVRTEKGRTKIGNIEDGTQAAHKIGFEVFNGIKQKEPGPGLSNPNRKEKIQSGLNSNVNIRNKSKYGNQVLDKRRDKRIVDVVNNGTKIKEKTTAKRAVQQYNAGMKVDNPDINRIAQKIGEAQVATGKVGRPPKIKNLAKQ